MPVIRKTFTRVDPTLRTVAHCLRNRNIPHEVFTDAEEAFIQPFRGSTASLCSGNSTLPASARHW